MKMKRVILLLITASVIGFISVLAVSDIPLITRYYTPVYWQYETTAGNGQPDNINQNNNFDNLNEDAKISIISDNFLNTIDRDKYYGGAYWVGDDIMRDENGEIMTNEKGKPLRKYEMDLYILVTDLKIVPDYLRTANPKLHFREVKYSEKQLCDWMDYIANKLITEQENTDTDKIKIGGMGLDTENNRIEIEVSEIFDISDMPPEIPEDAYVIEYGGGPAGALRLI